MELGTTSKCAEDDVLLLPPPLNRSNLAPAFLVNGEEDEEAVNGGAGIPVNS